MQTIVLASALTIAGGNVAAQPPLDVQYVHDPFLWAVPTGMLFYHPNSSYRVSVAFPGNNTFEGCDYEYQGVSFDPQGDQITPLGFTCFTLTGSYPIESMTDSGSGVGFIGDSWPVQEAMLSLPGTIWNEPYTANCMGTPTGQGGVSAYGYPGTVVYATSEPGYSIRVVYRVDYPPPSQQWCVPVAHLFSKVLLHGDTVLAVGFPTVTRLDLSSGASLGEFDLYMGDSLNIGEATISGDTLFWAAQFGGAQLQVGAYRMGQGPLWSTTLPFMHHPVGLAVDGHGHLWTAVNDQLIWLDRSTGTWSSTNYATEFKDLKGWHDDLFLFGLSGSQAFLMYAKATP
ncbi:MAG: hypothetical protein JNJ64_04995 [Flavobacteriales bacterium]|nr:hypothetical protein [Flavobacteriales bacterium]